MAEQRGELAGVLPTVVTDAQRILGVASSDTGRGVGGQVGVECGAEVLGAARRFDLGPPPQDPALDPVALPISDHHTGGLRHACGALEHRRPRRGSGQCGPREAVGRLLEIHRARVTVAQPDLDAAIPRLFADHAEIPVGGVGELTELSRDLPDPPLHCRRVAEPMLIRPVGETVEGAHQRGAAGLQCSFAWSSEIRGAYVQGDQAPQQIVLARRVTVVLLRRRRRAREDQHRVAVALVGSPCLAAAGRRGTRESSAGHRLPERDPGEELVVEGLGEGHRSGVTDGPPRRDHGTHADRHQLARQTGSHAVQADACEVAAVEEDQFGHGRQQTDLAGGEDDVVAQECPGPGRITLHIVAMARDV